MANREIIGGGGGANFFFSGPKRPPSYTHNTQKNYRTELYYFRIIFGSFCSVITEPICFWNYLVAVSSVSAGLPNSLWNYFR